MTNKALNKNNDYKQWLQGLKQSFAQAQIKAAVKVNSELLSFYWQLGEDIIEKQLNSTWGSGFLKQLSKDLSAEFPDIKGFSYRNLALIKQWYSYWPSDPAIMQQAVAQLVLLPWGHNQQIINKCKTSQEVHGKDTSKVIRPVPYYCHNCLSILPASVYCNV